MIRGACTGLTAVEHSQLRALIQLPASSLVKFLLFRVHTPLWESISNACNDICNSGCKRCSHLHGLQLPLYVLLQAAYAGPCALNRLLVLFPPLLCCLSVTRQRMHVTMLSSWHPLIGMQVLLLSMYMHPAVIHGHAEVQWQHLPTYLKVLKFLSSFSASDILPSSCAAVCMREEKLIAGRRHLEIHWRIDAHSKPDSRTRYRCSNVLPVGIPVSAAITPQSCALCLE